ncbi:MAG: hypothetical protein QG626_830 [Patescibacteria group bacterium]|nr:hypothetical protein [Patescibacteria group bacterium]
MRRFICGASGGIRTPDPQLRKLMLYPAELRPLLEKLPKFAGYFVAGPRKFFYVGFTYVSKFSPRASYPTNLVAFLCALRIEMVRKTLEKCG